MTDQRDDVFTELCRIGCSADLIAVTYHGVDNNLIDPHDLLTVQPGHLDRFLTDTGVRAAWQASMPDPNCAVSWCDRHATGHRWYDAGPGEWTRDHTKTVGRVPALVEIYSAETIDSDGHQQTAPAIRVYDLEDANLDPRQAVTVSILLSAAAEMVTQLVRGKQ